MATLHRASSSRSDLRGPGGTRGWPTNEALDPILTDYRLVRPWHGCVIADGVSTRYLAPQRSIVNNVADITVCEYLGLRDGRPVDPTFTSQKQNPEAVDGASDHLFAFEGGTGSIEGNPPAWSLVGIVLERHTGTTTYDIHIAYRGSQSGSAYRAAFHGLMLEQGNPDWVTDMEIFKMVKDHRFSPHGLVVRGFRDAVLSSMSSLVRCLEDVADRNGHPPDNIRVSGHSLGGGLAIPLAASLTIGNIASSLPEALRSWPMQDLALTTFGAPKAGDDDFAELFDANVSARRVWAEGDPITEFPLNSHVGRPVPLHTNVSGTANHEPGVLRQAVIQQAEWARSTTHQALAATDPWQNYETIGDALWAADQAGERLEYLFPTAVGDPAELLVDVAADVVGASSSYRMPFTKIPAELRRRSRQVISVFDELSGSVAQAGQHLGRFRGIQPGSDVENHLRRLFLIREAVRNDWTVADLLEDEAIARVFGTFARLRPTDRDAHLDVSRASGPPPNERDVARVNQVLWMRRIHRSTVHDSTDKSFRRRVPPISGMPHLVRACGHYEGLSWLPTELMVAKDLPDEAQLLTKYKAFYYGLGKLGFGAYERWPIRQEVPWDPEFAWNQAFPSTGDGWAHPTSDETFVRLRLQGPNPFLLKKVDDHFELDFGDSFAGTLPRICARFDLRNESLVARDISIGSFTHTPTDRTWDRAKRVVNAADIRYVPFGRHLLEVHFIVGQAFALAAYSLPTWHRLRPFMGFFSFGTMQVNDFAYQAFFTKSSYFIKSGFMTGDAAAQLFASLVRDFDLDGWIPPKDITRRGLHDIANHPYAEDALRVWPELVATVEQYLDLLEINDETIASDDHLQIWYLTLLNLIPNREARDAPLTRQTLVELCAGFLYNNVVHEVCGDMSPILGSLDPDDKSIINLKKFADAVGDGELNTPLPAPSMADVFLMDQASYTSQFNVGGNKLLDLTPDRWIDDPKLAETVKDLQRRLTVLGDELAATNEKRSVRFSRMLPSEWEASISF